jgi:hypothetical protein
MFDLVTAVSERRILVDRRNRADHPVAAAALDAVIAADDQDWYGILCDWDGSFVFRYRDYSVALRYQESLLPHWELRAEGAGVALREVVYDLRQGLIHMLAHLDLMAARIREERRCA